MSLAIPCVPDGQSSWRQRTSLDGRDYILRFEWFQRDGAWRFSIADQNDSPIAVGIKIVTDWPLLFGVVDARRPAGQLMIIDERGEGLDPSFSELGSRFTLVYFTAAELAAT